MFFQSKETKFWKWFEQNEQQLFEMQTLDNDLFAEISSRLQNIQAGLSFAISPLLDDNTKELVISADGIIERFPAVIALIQKAPQLPHWRIKAFRQRQTSDDIQIKLGNFLLSYDDIFFKYLIEEGKVCLQLHIRYFRKDDPFIDAVFLLLDALLGEYDVGTQIGFIDWMSLDESLVDELLPFLMLRDIVDKNKASKN